MEDIHIGDEYLLKPLDRKMAPAFLNLINKNRSYLRQWLGWVDDMNTISDVDKYIDASLRDLSIRKLARFWILKSENLVGIIHLTDIDWQKRKASIGYWVGEEFRGKKAAEKAVTGLIGFAFNDWKLAHLEIRCATDNAASQAIPLKLGFKKEEIIKDSEWLYDHYVDHQVFSLSNNA